jgi:hypothetical protein
MSKIVFQVPDSGFNPGRKGDPLSPTTQLLYKSKLNVLAAAGYPTVADIWKNALKVVKVIKEATGDGETDNDKIKRRQFLSAIFAVSPIEKKSTNNAFYRYYQKCLPAVNDVTGLAWKKKKDMV